VFDTAKDDVVVKKILDEGTMKASSGFASQVGDARMARLVNNSLLLLYVSHGLCRGVGDVHNRGTGPR
jgi:hypothetical protein